MKTLNQVLHRGSIYSRISLALVLQFMVSTGNNTSSLKANVLVTFTPSISDTICFGANELIKKMFYNAEFFKSIIAYCFQFLYKLIFYKSSLKLGVVTVLVNFYSRMVVKTVFDSVNLNSSI